MSNLRRSVLLLLAASCACTAPPPGDQLALPGLQAPVRIQRDRWGVSHIYAENQRDLFFAQGFNAARDRLFQLEMWRRTATGTLSEAFGERYLKTDIGNRLLRLRVGMEEELKRYHPQAQEIVTAFVDGINAYVDHLEASPELLPEEFRLLGIKPGRWTPEIVVSRHNGLYRNASQEVALLELARRIGVEKMGELLDFQPARPEVDEGRLKELPLIPAHVLDVYRASRRPPSFEAENIVVEQARSAEQTARRLSGLAGLEEDPLDEADRGSNNWALAGHRSQTGQPLLANDPHRSVRLPSLRYFVHLSAPGWNVIGGGEPALPGVSIGHNEFGAWGLTIFSIDQEDLYVYDTRPADPPEYRYQDGWEAMRVERETIAVKGNPDHEERHLFTRHGPVIHYDEETGKAYALKAAWLMPGTSPYLAGLRFDQARTWEEFQKACYDFWMPSENMVWAGRDGRIGWQSTGIAPVRKGWAGLFPVPGDGRYEWSGLLDAAELPSVVDPPEGFFASANQFNLPDEYPHVLGYRWSDPFRQQRLVEVLSEDRLFGIEDMMRLQHDVRSVVARRLIDILRGVKSEDAKLQPARAMLAEWDQVLDADSPAAALYMKWKPRLSDAVWNAVLGEERPLRLPFRVVVDLLEKPERLFQAEGPARRDEILLTALGEAVEELESIFGEDVAQWRYGSLQFHHSLIRHPLSAALAEERRARLDAGPLPRGGNGHTVNQTNDGANQRSGATFRVVVDVSDWDNGWATNSPGQSGDPRSPHYRDLFEDWVAGEYFPLVYSKERVEAETESRLTLIPRK